MTATRLTVLLVLSVVLPVACRNQPVSFNSEIRPLLNAKCVTCHGGVKRSGDLNLLFRSEALGAGESGRPAIIPGNAAGSELIRRVTHSDPAERMPRGEAPLTSDETDLLRTWIDRGAEWETHWAYLKPVRSELPRVTDETWPRNEIDHFVLAGLEPAGLEPSPPADRATLIRRVSLDLTGLPPTPEEVDDFVADNGTDAYERVVDRLLASPHFGERWAAMWLDLARYADTMGYERDPPREIWLYRDWLIRAFNRDLPFDQFTIEQLAGDLLAEPTREQYFATAFHRNTMNNDEGGTDNEEYRVAAVIDRVNTTWEVWMGTSMGCVQCHGHPYDPFRHEEYYQSFALFNNTCDEDTPSESPVYKVLPEPEEESLEELERWAREHTEGTPEDKERAARRLVDLVHFTEPKIHPHSFEILRNGTHADTKYLVMYDQGVARLPRIRLDGKGKLLVHLRSAENGTRVQLRLDEESGPLLTELKLSKEHRGHFWFDLKPAAGSHDIYFHFENPTLKKEQGTSSIHWIMFLEELPGSGADGFDRIERQLTRLLDLEAPSVPILVENPPEFARETRLFERGNWLVPGERVRPGIPASLPAPADGEVGDRLDFARWVVSPDNPLTARVTVNRFWEKLFGIGLVETLEDFGTQGASPSHPELLDWLAVEFMETHGWSVKKLLRQMVLSSTYRQTARVTPDRLERDPRNRLLSRGPRFRLTAEQLRDQVLAVGGLLSRKMFGPSVMPYQPEGVWQVIYSNEKWETSPGDDRYRRALYTYWRRTSPYPSMVAFDSPSREFCVPRRIRTNTPLQALVTLNDPTYFEAAEALAGRMLEEGGDTPEDWIRRGFRLALAREPGAEECRTLLGLFDEARTTPLSDQGSGVTGRHEWTSDVWGLTVVANSIMNLDEFLNK